MERAPKLNLCLGLCLFFIQHFFHVSTMGGGGEQTDNNRNPGFISIDCGATSDYLDKETGIWYQKDTYFVETGTNAMVPPSGDLNYHSFEGLLTTLRSFPEGKRNCYTLKPKQGKHHTYLIRAYFAYGNYDGKNQTPIFDLYLGVNYWETIDWGMDYYFTSEIFHTPTIDTIHVCLVKTAVGVPYISALELRPLSNSIYQTPSPSQSLLLSLGRFEVASTSLDTFSRYQDDIYDRIWCKIELPDWYPIIGYVDIDPASTNDSYKLPEIVLESASQSLNLSYALNFDYNSVFDLESSFEYYVYFHFSEIQQLPNGQKRIINITVDDKKIITKPIILEYLKPQTIASPHTARGNNVRFSISATSESNAPPLLNAFEVYQFISPIPSPTDKKDVDAIMDIKYMYKIFNLDWQGDPCVPKLAWDGLSCSSGVNGNSARITSVNLSSSNLKGQISESFARLSKLESLDLSNNELTGQLPEFLATLPNLKFINVAGNKLTGSIPKPLKEKAELQISVANNPGLCQKNSCKKHKFVIPIIASVANLVILIVIVSLAIWRFSQKRVMLTDECQKTEAIKQKNKSFSYSEILHITHNFETAIGEGGFGKVYLGTLEDDTKVAVKLLSPSSRQGYKEFLSEAQLLTVIHHRNLVSLIGFCDENEFKALIYEYMDLGDLRGLLSGKNTKVLMWNERLQVAIDAAKGLEYLHNGCKTPIIHRDLKPSNILLNQSMVAKIADFGLSRAFKNEKDTHLSTHPAGTPGYIDPEFQRSGKLNKQSDMYSFGMILLQLITGRPPIRREVEDICFIIDWIHPKIECVDIQGIVDVRLRGEFHVGCAWKAVETAMSCIAAQSTHRPDISYVLNELKECLAMETGQYANSNAIQSHPINHSGGNLDSITTLSAR